MSNAPTLAALLPRLFISMAVVILVMYVVARVLKNRQLPGSGRIMLGSKTSAAAPATLQVINRQGVGKGASVSIVRAGDRTLVLGITDTQVSLLTELVDDTAGATAGIDLDEVSAKAQRTDLSASSAGTAALDPAWKGLLEQVRERTVRKA